MYCDFYRNKCIHGQHQFMPWRACNFFSFFVLFCACMFPKLQTEGSSYLPETRSRSRDPKGGLAKGNTAPIFEDLNSPRSPIEELEEHRPKNNPQQQRQQREEHLNPASKYGHGSGAGSVSPPSVGGSYLWRQQRMEEARGGSSFHRTESFGDNNRLVQGRGAWESVCRVMNKRRELSLTASESQFCCTLIVFKKCPFFPFLFCPPIYL